MTEATRIEKVQATAKAKRHNRPFHEMGFDTQRKVVIEQQEGKCNKCKLSEWMMRSLVLEIDHINGDHHDNRRENLEALCPNCHSLTPTFRAKNRKIRSTGTMKKVTDEVLLVALKSEPTIAHALRRVGLVPRGGNYYRAKRLLGL